MQKAKAVKSLNENWQFRQARTQTWYPASVPGCNFTDLMDNQLIADPFYADNETALQWIEGEDWEYKTDFHLTERELNEKNWLLVFAGLDTYADVFVNGQLVATSKNMFVPIDNPLFPVSSGRGKPPVYTFSLSHQAHASLVRK